jgi:hypothetical protein
MRGFKGLVFSAVVGSCITAFSATAQAPRSINFAEAPECPYGYYDTAPYNCAPSGYYGPQWFDGEAFIGAGPWFHGAHDFHGLVNNAYHPDHGYRGAMPARGEKAKPARRIDSAHFAGNEERDGRGNAAEQQH